jgi:hypothetical protein
MVKVVMKIVERGSRAMCDCLRGKVPPLIFLLHNGLPMRMRWGILYAIRP